MKSCAMSKGMFQLEQRSNGVKEQWIIVKEYWPSG